LPEGEPWAATPATRAEKRRIERRMVREVMRVSKINEWEGRYCFEGTREYRKGDEVVEGGEVGKDLSKRRWDWDIYLLKGWVYISFPRCSTWSFSRPTSRHR
jgi:hypothetical protein